MSFLVVLWTLGVSQLAVHCPLLPVHSYRWCEGLLLVQNLFSPILEGLNLVFCYVGAQKVKEASIDGCVTIYGNNLMVIFTSLLCFRQKILHNSHIDLCQPIWLMVVGAGSNMCDIKFSHSHFELFTSVARSIVRDDYIWYPKFTEDGLKVLCNSFCCHAGEVSNYRKPTHVVNHK